MTTLPSKDNRDFDIIAFDIETSGVGKPHPVFNEDGQPYALLSIGAVRLSDFQTFYVELKYDSLLVSPEATRIHGIDLSTLDGEGKVTPHNADLMLRDWLKSDPYYKEGKHYTLIPMGFNVGSFDMDFIREWSPKSADLFGYRSMDLNALLFDEAVQKGQSFYQVKKQAKHLGETFAIYHFGENKPHHALYDAWVAMGVYHYLHGTEPKKVGEAQWEGGKLDA